MYLWSKALEEVIINLLRFPTPEFKLSTASGEVRSYKLYICYCLSENWPSSHLASYLLAFAWQVDNG